MPPSRRELFNVDNCRRGQSWFRERVPYLTFRKNGDTVVTATVQYLDASGAMEAGPTRHIVP